MTDTQVMAALNVAASELLEGRGNWGADGAFKSGVSRMFAKAKELVESASFSPAAEPAPCLPGWFYYAMKAAKESGKDLILEAKDIDALLAAPVPPPAGEDRFRVMLLDLLAVIHGDGGHKTQEIGVDMAHAQAMQLSSERKHLPAPAGDAELRKALELARPYVANSLTAAILTLSTRPSPPRQGAHKGRKEPPQ